MEAEQQDAVQQLLQGVPHPYVGVPDSIVLEGYHDVILGSDYLIAPFFAVISVVVGILWLLTRHVATGQRLQLVWFVVSGLIHLCVEGPYILYPDFYTNADPNMFMLELWKEYSKADSRYATRDSLIVAIEACTAFIMGPLCLLAAVGLFAKSSWRFAVITLVSVCQFYGTVFYFLTSVFEGLPHTRPEPLYFWFLFTGMNTIWLVLPAICTWDALRKMTSAVHATSKSRKKLV